MTDIRRLEERLQEAQAIAARYRDIHSESPNDVSLRLSLASAQYEVEQIQQEIQAAKRERWLEVVEFRFLGKQAQSGSLPLHLIGDVLSTLAESLHESSYYVLNGRPHRYGPMPTDIVSSLDLRLVDLAPGSTRVFISGQLNPDMFGNSLLEDSLSGTFAVLTANDTEELADAVNCVGLGGVRKLQVFLEELSKADLEVEVYWETPRNERKGWEGRRRVIRRLSDALARIDVTTKDTWVLGRVISLSLRGRVEIKADGGATYQCTFPMKLLETVRQFTIDDIVLAHININTFLNQATGERRDRYTLITLRDPEKFKGKEHL